MIYPQSRCFFSLSCVGIPNAVYQPKGNARLQIFSIYIFLIGGGEERKVPLLFFDWLINICIIVLPGASGALCNQAGQ